MKYTGLAYNPSKNYQWSIHAAGCSDIAKELRGIGTDSGFRAELMDTFEADNLEAALDHIIDEEMVSMGWNHDDVKVFPCCKGKHSKAKLDQRHNEPNKDYFCLRCKRVHGSIYRKYQAHLKYEKVKGDKSLGKCKICHDFPAASLKRTITVRSPLGENPIAICKHCEDTKTDFEMIASLLPMRKESMAKSYIYGRSKVSPALLSKPITATVCINDIKKNKLDWKGYYGQRQNLGGKGIAKTEPKAEDNPSCGTCKKASTCKKWCNLSRYEAETK